MLREVLNETLTSFSKSSATVPQGFSVLAVANTFQVSERAVVTVSKEIATSLGLVVTENAGGIFFQKRV